MKRSVNTHSFIEQDENHSIKIKDEECLLFLDVRGTGEDIKNEDFILLNRNGRIVKYLVHNLKYKKDNKFTAKLIFTKYED